MTRALSVRISVCVLFLVIAISAQTPSGPSSDKTYVGILDDAREEMVNWKPGVARERVVRPAFEKTATGWKVVDSFPARMSWTVAFDGKNLGSVDTQPGSDESFTLVQKIVTPASSVPVSWVSVAGICWANGSWSHEGSSSVGSSLETIFPRSRWLDTDKGTG